MVRHGMPPPALICRYLVEQAIGLQRPQLRGAAFMAAAAITACKPDMQWLKEQRSFMHAAKVVW